MSTREENIIIINMTWDNYINEQSREPDILWRALVNEPDILWRALVNEDVFSRVFKS